MRKLPSFLLAALFSTTILATPAFATSPSGETEAPGQAFVHPSDDASYSKDMRDDEMLAKSKATDNGKVQYVSGGIAVSGMKAIDAEEHFYNLKMLFVAEPSGEYLANIGIKIDDDQGKTILDTTAKGPVLLVKLPHGHYTVTATRETGVKLTRKVEAGEDHLSSYVLRYADGTKN